MATINPEIDAAVVKRKARAAQFNHRTMADYEDAPWWETAQEFVERAVRNLESAWRDLQDGEFAAADEIEADICDAGNLGDLALSVLPKDGS